MSGAMLCAIPPTRSARLSRMDYLLSILPVIVVGITLASLLIAQARGHRADMHRLEAKMDAKIDALEAKMDAKIDALEAKMDAKIDTLEAKMDAKIDGLEEKMDGRFEGLGIELGSLRERMAHLEGLMNGLREAITGRKAA